MCVFSEHTSVGLQWFKNINTDILLSIQASVVYAHGNQHICVNVLVETISLPLDF